MPKPKLFTYEKKAPFRDASFFIIICEGESREPDYFKFFDGISSKVKVVPVANVKGHSSPLHLIDNASRTEAELEVDSSIDTLWFVIDTDKWSKQIHELREECNLHSHWQVIQSNPCFEVWLYFNAKTELPALDDITQCNKWKTYLPLVIKGGFNSDFHPVAIETAVLNSKTTCIVIGYSPNPGSTQVWQLGEALMPLIQKDLEALRDKFTIPEVMV